MKVAQHVHGLNGTELYSLRSLILCYMCHLNTKRAEREKKLAIVELLPYIRLCAKIMYYPIKCTKQLCESLSPFHRTANQGSCKLISITNNTWSCNSNPGLSDSKAYTL